MSKFDKMSDVELIALTYKICDQGDEYGHYLEYDIEIEINQAVGRLSMEVERAREILKGFIESGEVKE